MLPFLTLIGVEDDGVDDHVVRCMNDCLHMAMYMQASKPTIISEEHIKLEEFVVQA